jgi:hypothetical protein
MVKAVRQTIVMMETRYINGVRSKIRKFLMDFMAQRSGVLTDASSV